MNWNINAVASHLWSLVPKDIINSFVIGFLSAVGFAVLPLLESGKLPTLESIPTILLSGLTVTIANIIRKYLTNSNNTFLGAETKSEPKS